MCVDLGGTTITAGVVEGSDILSLKTVSTGGDRPSHEILDTIIRLIENVSKKYSIDGIGIGVPNPAGPKSDRLYLVENLPQLENFPLKSRLSEYFTIPVILENDANCMALGEHRAGALKGFRNCVCITLGTGLGCGIIIDGKIYRGNSYCAGEIWNIPWIDGRILEDGIGVRGLEAIYTNITGSSIEPHGLYGMYGKGDPGAVEAFDTYGISVGAVMVMILSFLDPERIAVGGGISESFDAYSGSMFRVVEETWGKEAAQKVVPAELSDKAALLGAAECIEEHIDG